jgi:DNA gyrase subunit B
LNVEKARFDKMLSSKEIMTLISALGCGIGEEHFDIDKLRYHYIIIMTDADVDGSHIRTLLLTFFYRQMAELIDRGYLYIAQPPLYKVKRGRREQYLKDENALQAFLIDSATTGVRIVGRQELGGKELGEFIAELADYRSTLVRLERYGDSRVFDVAVEMGLTAETLDDPATAAAIAAEILASLRAKYPTVRWDEPRLEEVSDFDAGLDPIDGEGEGDLGDGSGEPEDGGDYAEDVLEAEPHHSGLRITFRSRVQGTMTSTVFDAAFLDVGAMRKLRTVKARMDAVRGESGTEVWTENAETPVVLTTQDALLDHILELGRKGLSIQRYKGLGEMNPDQLWETTMDPDTRTLLQVRVEDAARSDEMFTVLMGDAVEPRRDFIVEHALDVRNLDV